MLNPEQQQVRLRDAEITRLKAENIRLTNRIKEIQVAMVEMIRGIAYTLPVSVRSMALSKAKKLEESIKP